MDILSHLSDRIQGWKEGFLASSRLLLFQVKCTIT
jgi:hypothetical protein